MSLSDFDALTPDELTSAIRYHREAGSLRLREEWEQTRLLATIFVQPFSKKKITPRSLLPFPWDDEDREKHEEAPRSTPERLRALLDQMDKTDGK